MFSYPIDTYTDKDIALQELASMLNHGTLCLFLGTGVSLSTEEFPGWLNLVRACGNEKGLDISDLKQDAPIDKLLKSMEKVSDSCEDFEEYKELVKRNLNQDFQLEPRHAQNMLLISIGALIMNSRRGSVTEVITYNFDDLLEWYLNLHGFRVQVVSELPFLFENADVRVFHPHGFLPKSARYENAEHFIFDSFAYDLTVGNKNYPWFSLCKQLLLQRIVIMVGLSCDDPALVSLVTQTYNELTNANCSRPVVFLLNRSDSIVNDDSWFFKRGIVPIGFNNYDEIWEYLLKICQKSADFV